MQLISEREAPVLSMAPGFYRDKPVLPVLQRHFLYAWRHSKPLGATECSAVVPDAGADLIWCRDALWVAGPDLQVKLERVPPGTAVVGMRFLPGVAATLLRVPVSQIVGARVPLDCFWPKTARELTDAVGDAREPYAVATRLEAALAKMVGNFVSPDPCAEVIRRCVARPRDGRRPIVPQLTAALCVSERTLRRYCERAFGYGPKTLDRVLRMQRFLELARGRPGPGLANLAGAAGYADQAHLTREARRLTGLTPAAIIKQLSEAKKHEIPPV